MDTCALSELGKIEPNLKVRGALLELPREELRLSAISLGEIQYGIDLCADSNEKARLNKWFHLSVLAVFGNRIIDVDTFVAMRWGSLFADLKSRGKKMQIQDSQIAATALVHNLTLVTRNEKDFAHCGVRIFNPWR